MRPFSMFQYVKIFRYRSLSELGKLTRVSVQSNSIVWLQMLMFYWLMLTHSERKKFFYTNRKQN